MSRSHANPAIEKKEPVKLFENFKMKRQNDASRVDSIITDTKTIDRSEGVSGEQETAKKALFKLPTLDNKDLVPI